MATIAPNRKHPERRIVPEISRELKVLILFLTALGLMQVVSSGDDHSRGVDVPPSVAAPLFAQECGLGSVALWENYLQVRGAYPDDQGRVALAIATTMSSQLPSETAAQQKSEVIAALNNGSLEEAQLAEQADEYVDTCR